ncbi:MAG: bifunctional DNA primase/helicase [Bacteroidales bacterium]|nr:bifunctional DNA primase/helicase [Bacteroidales bacterium]MCD8395054.1 bifunctional DNA primase/helicase [Bacteroidales bacterium]
MGRNEKRERILEMTDGGRQVFAYYLGPDFKVKRKFRNPFYEDTKASCHVTLDPRSNKYILYDFGDPDCGGDCFWFVGMANGLDPKRDFGQIMDKIIRDLSLPLGTGNDVMPMAVTPPSRPKPKRAKAKTPGVPCDYTTQPWPKHELAYWGRYGISEEILDKYNVASLSIYSSVGEHGPYSYYSHVKSPMFGYLRDGFVKIYRPYENVRFQFGGEKPVEYSFGMEQLPSHGDIVFITGGEKDVLTLAAHGFNAICFNSETKPLSESTIAMLKLRFRHIIVMYDADQTGIEWMKRAEEEHEDVLTLQLPLPGTKSSKDISDFFAEGRTVEDFHRLVMDLLESVYADSMMLIKTCELDAKHPPIRSQAVITAQDVPIGTYDNLLCVTGGEGTGKSNFVSSLLSGTLLERTPDYQVDTLGFDVAPNVERKAVLLFDTEQSGYQLFKNSDMTMRRAGLQDWPDFYHSFYLTPLSRSKRLQVIRDAMDRFHHLHGGIHLVVIDGVADLVKSANDEKESVAIIEELYRLAAIYHTCIICVLHLVPNGYKLRGHIGSELQRKAAAILSIEKDDNPTRSVVKTMKVRDGNPLAVPMFLFKWDTEKRMHVSDGQKTDEEWKQSKLDRLETVAKELLKGKSLNYTDFWSAVKEKMDVGDRTAKEYVSIMYKNGIVTTTNKMYHLKNTE